MLDAEARAVRDTATRDIERTHQEGLHRYGKDAERLVTPKQELAFRLRHHDFHGLSLSEVARAMGVEEQAVTNLLTRMQSAAPQMFPILSPRIARMYQLFTEDNMTCKEIAEEVGVTPRAVQKALRDLYDRRKVTGLWFRSGSGRKLSYQPWMDTYTRVKF
jgi:predicted DNA-binding protein YlxM (UPF0122 family)